MPGADPGPCSSPPGGSEIALEEHKDGMRMGRDPEDVVAFMLSDEMGRRLVDGKDRSEVGQAGTEAAVEDTAAVRHVRGCRIGRRLLARNRLQGVAGVGAIRPPSRPFGRVCGKMVVLPGAEGLPKDP